MRERISSTPGGRVVKSSVIESGLMRFAMKD